MKKTSVRDTIKVKGSDSVRCEIVIDPDCEEKVVIYARGESPLIEEIKKLTDQVADYILGYLGSEIIRLDTKEIQYINVVSGRVYAVCDKKYLLKDRLYVLETKLPDCFVRINQSCLANIGKMERFDTSVSGTLKIRFKNGDVDYVSRRQLKAVKERIGI